MQEWKKIEKRNLFILFLFVVGSIYFLSSRITISVLLGGGIAVLNFRWLAVKLSSLVEEKEKVEKSGMILFALLKYPLLFLVIGFLFLKTPIHIIGFMIGFASLIFAILSEGVFPSNRKQISSP